MTWANQKTKRFLDASFSAAFLALIWPFFLVLAVLVKLDTPGPALYRARRTGLKGEVFTMYKFRTMATGGETGPPITSKADPRTTRTGRFLRQTRMDELPQLINVLKGEMSLVGPRPEDPTLVALYSTDQRQVLELRPGITGLSQLEFRGEESFLSPADPVASYVSRVMPRKLAVDLYYLKHQSLALDFDILLRTLLMPLGSYSTR